jgi:anoctamin-10
MRIVASVPVIVMFASILAALLTGIFVIEAFVTQLYTGPGHKYVVSHDTSMIIFNALTYRHLVFQPDYSLYRPRSSRPLNLSHFCSTFHGLGEPRSSFISFGFAYT